LLARIARGEAIMGPLYAQITVHATVVPRGGETKSIANVYNFRRDGSVNPRVKQEVSDAFQSAIQSFVLAALSIDYTQVANTVRWLDDATDMPQDFAEAHVGAITGQRYDNFTAAFILLKTTSRKTKGSKHYSPLGEDTVSGDEIVVGELPNFQDIADNILTGFTDASGNIWKSTIVNTKNAIFGVNPTLFGDSLVTSALVRKTVGTMKRRKVRGVY